MNKSNEAVELEIEKSQLSLIKKEEDVVDRIFAKCDQILAKIKDRCQERNDV